MPVSRDKNVFFLQAFSCFSFPQGPRASGEGKTGGEWKEWCEREGEGDERSGGLISLSKAL